MCKHKQNKVLEHQTLNVMYYEPVCENENIQY